MTRRIDFGLLLALVLPLAAVAPLLQHAGVPNVADGVIHVLRQVDFDRAFRSGALVPRWGADLYLGFGYPLYIFAPPLLAYAVELIHLLGAAMDDALKLVVIATLELYSLGMFLFMRPKVGTQGALAAAALNVYAPMRLREALVTGGNYPQFVAMALFPLILWAFDGIIRTNARRYVILAALSYAALILSHIFHALIFTPVAAAYVLLRLLQARAAQGVWIMAFSAGLLAVLISTFFWLPAIVERPLTRTAAEEYIRSSDFHQRFLSWHRLLAPPLPLDNAEANADVPLSLGWAQLAAGALGLAGALWGAARARRVAPLLAPLFFLLLLAASVFLQLPESAPIWEHVSLLPVAEFPWRFMGLSAFALAALGGYGVLALSGDPVEWSLHTSWRQDKAASTKALLHGVATTVIVAIAVVSAFPYTVTPRGFAQLGTPTPETVLQYEQSTGAAGLTTINEYLPQTVQHLPADVPAPLSRPKIDLPASALLAGRWSPQGESDRVQMPQAGTVRFRIFNYPGWTAGVDGKAVPALTQDDGTFTIEVPEGEHQIEVRFAETPARLFGETISVLALLALLPILFLPLRRGRGWQIAWREEHEAGGIPDGQLGWVAIALVLLFAAKFALVDPQGWLSVTRYAQPLATFDGQMELLGGESDQSVVARGGSLQARFFWRPTQPLAVDYHVIAQLIAPDGQAIAGSDKQHPGDPVVQGETPTTQIPPGMYLRDEHQIAVPATAAPGRYELRVGLYDPQTGKRLKLPDGQTLFAVGVVDVK